MDARSSDPTSIPTLTLGGVLPAARMLFLGIPAREADFATRGFHCADSQSRRHLEESGRVFLRGFNSVIAAGATTRLSDDLQSVSIEMRGFAFEGGGVGVCRQYVERPHDTI